MKSIYASTLKKDGKFIPVIIYGVVMYVYSKFQFDNEDSALAVAQCALKESEGFFLQNVIAFGFEKERDCFWF